MSAGLLLDTCVVVWLSDDPKQLSPACREAILEHSDALFVSAISAFEISVKYRRQRLALPSPPEVWFPKVVRHHRIRVASITARIALAAAALPSIHGDPADRLIVATAQVRDYAVLTPDAVIKSYPQAEVIW